MGEVDEVGRAGAPPATEVTLEQEEARSEAEHEALEAKLARHIHASKSWLFAALLLTIFIALLSSVASGSNVAYALLGFSPTLITTLLFLFLLDSGYKDVLYWFTPLAVAALFFVLGEALNTVLLGQLDLPVLTGVNLILSYFILLVMILIEYYRTREQEPATLEEIEHFKPEHLEKYIHTIEDKCKALNFVMGRVYRASHGGTARLREKIKVPSEWYNEFNTIAPEEVKEQKDLAIDLLTRIEERLSLLLKPERSVFDHEDVRGLKHLARDPDGKDRIIDVLTVNDNDPVEDYFLGAVDFCKRIKTELQKL